MSLLSSESWHPIPPTTPSCSSFSPPPPPFPHHALLTPAWWWSTQRKCIPSCLLIGGEFLSSPIPEYMQLLTFRMYNFFVVCTQGFSSALKTYFFCLPHARRKKRSTCCLWITWRSEMLRKALCPQSTSSQSLTLNRGQVYVVKWKRINAHVPLPFVFIHVLVYRLSLHTQSFSRVGLLFICAGTCTRIFAK